jgi:hypothetical protein
VLKLSKNSNLNLLIVAFVSVLIGFGFATYKAPSFSQYAHRNQVSIDVVSIQETQPLYSIEVEYPQLKNASPSLNSQISSNIENSITEFKQNSTANWQARQNSMPNASPEPAPTTPPFFLTTTWQPYQLNSQYVSLIVRNSAFEGGANSSQTLATYNFDLQNQKSLTLADVLPAEDDLLEKVSAIARQQLADSLAVDGGRVDTQMLDDGTQPTADNFANFTFDHTNVTIFFPKYQVAAGVYGEQQVIIPRDSTMFDQAYQDVSSN